MPELAFCLDVSPQLGAGHLNRCATIAEAASRLGASSHFFIRGDAAMVAARLPDRSCWTHLPDTASPEEEGATLCAAFALCDFSALVVDHQRGLPEWQAAIAPANVPWLQFDYRKSFTHRARWLVNLNPAAQPAWYEGLIQPPTTLLLGPAYAVLRPEFLQHRPTAPAPAKPLSTVLLSFGGGSDQGAAERFTRLLLGLSDCHLQLVSTAFNPSLPALQALQATHPGRITLAISPPSFAALAVQSDLAITTGGTTAFELAALGLPFILTQIADNQMATSAAWAALGCALDAGPLAALDDARFAALWQKASDPATRQTLGAKGWSLVDGEGAGRLARILLGIAN